MSRFLFGPFEFDSGTLDLRRDGAPVRLQSQPAHVLKALLENADQIVTRDHLRRALWDDSTFVDFESGLNFCISQLRAALRDDASQPLYIRTVPKKGYQLIAPVRPALVPAPRLQPSDENFPRSRFSPRLLITSAIIIALIVVSLLLTLRPRHRQPVSTTKPATPRSTLSRTT
jgi:DNA-binding winged helix-turn-helix (wHTH) protein